LVTNGGFVGTGGLVGTDLRSSLKRSLSPRASIVSNNIGLVGTTGFSSGRASYGRKSFELGGL